MSHFQWPILALIPTLLQAYPQNDTVQGASGGASEHIEAGTTTFWLYLAVILVLVLVSGLIAGTCSLITHNVDRVDDWTHVAG
jgi:uncharacterized membrane protein